MTARCIYCDAEWCMAPDGRRAKVAYQVCPGCQVDQARAIETGNWLELAIRGAATDTPEHPHVVLLGCESGIVH
jgi:hypothetical protein